MADTDRTRPLSYLRSPLIAIAIVGVLILIRPLAWGVANLLLMLFGAVLLAVLLDGLAYFLRRFLKLGRVYALIGVVLLIVLGTVALGWTIGPRIDDQIGQLAEQLPQSINQLETWIRNAPWAARILETLRASDQLLPRPSDVVEAMPGVFYTTVGGLLGIAAVVITGFYLALEPSVYRSSILALLPAHRQEQGAEVLDALSRALQWWLVGRLTAMLAVALLTIVGLWIIEMPLALSLGLLAGILSFIPLLGPVLSAIPAVLIGFVDSPTKALGVIVVYGIVQFLEGNFITPYIQKRAVALPPAMLLTAQLLVGVPFGLIGVLLATPLAVAIIVVVQIVYVRGLLGHPVVVLGDHAANAE